MATTCFTCGADGHIARNCPNEEVLDTRPPWCGVCDPDTRIVSARADGDVLRKCPTCHPSPSKQLPQHSRCGKCKETVYKWDLRTECGKHLEVGAPLQPDTEIA